MNIELASTEIAGVKRTWDIAKKNLTETGTEVLLAYFENNPKKQSLFKRFSNVPFHQLNSKNAFIAQATLVMSALDDIVMSVDNPPAMKNKMIQLGRYHRMIKAKAKVVDFLEFNKVLMSIFPRLMEREWNHDAELGWIKVLSMLQMNVALGLDA